MSVIIKDSAVPGFCLLILAEIRLGFEHDANVGKMLTDLEVGRDVDEFNHIIAKHLDMTPGVARRYMKRFQNLKAVDRSGATSKRRMSTSAVRRVTQPNMDKVTLEEAIELSKKKHLVKKDIDHIYRANHPKKKKPPEWIWVDRVGTRSRDSRGCRVVDTKYLLHAKLGYVMYTVKRDKDGNSSSLITLVIGKKAVAQTVNPDPGEISRMIARGLRK